MLSVKDINNKRFEQARPGYSTEEVDDFLRQIAQEITQYQREKEEAEEKIKVLVESVKEYKKDEDIIKDTLIGAQKQGRAVIAEAQEKADKIIADANVQAEEIIGSTRIRLEKEKACLAKVQQDVSDFKKNLLDMYKKHLELITAIPESEEEEDEEEEEENTVVPAAEEKPAEPAAEPVIEEETVKAPEQDMEATKIMDNPYRQEKPAFPFGETVIPNTTRPESKFGELKFGNHK